MRTIRDEIAHVLQINRVCHRKARTWKGEVRTITDGPLAVGQIFNLVDDSNKNNLVLLDQLRALITINAPEGYTFIVGINAKAVQSQVPTVYTSGVIKSKFSTAFSGV